MFVNSSERRVSSPQEEKWGTDDENEFDLAQSMTIDKKEIKCLALCVKKDEKQNHYFSRGQPQTARAT